MSARPSVNRRFSGMPCARSSSARYRPPGRESGPDAMHDHADACRRRAACEQVAQRFRQPDEQDGRHQDGQDAADEEHVFPAVVLEQESVEEAAESAAEREGRPDQARHHRPAPARGVLGGERDEAGRRAAQAEPREKADGDERLQRGHVGRCDREKAEGGGGEDQHPLAAEPVSERAERQGSDHRPEQARREDRTKRRAGELEVVENHRRGEGNRLAVDAVEEGHHRAQHDRRDLVAGDWTVVDHPGDVDRIALERRHDAFLPRTSSVAGCEPRIVSISSPRLAWPPRQATY